MNKIAASLVVLMLLVSGSPKPKDELLIFGQAANEFLGLYLYCEKLSPNKKEFIFKKDGHNPFDAAILFENGSFFRALLCGGRDNSDSSYEKPKKFLREILSKYPFWLDQDFISFFLEELDISWKGKKPYVYTPDYEKPISMIAFEGKINAVLWLSENRYQLVFWPRKNPVL